jgi:hypothetical protein
MPNISQIGDAMRFDVIAVREGVGGKEGGREGGREGGGERAVGLESSIKIQYHTIRR